LPFGTGTDDPPAALGAAGAALFLLLLKDC
jgi:hypothetical protein